MSEPGHDPEGTVEVEVRVLLDLLHTVVSYWSMSKDSNPELYRSMDLYRRVEGGQVYVGVNDWPVDTS